MLDVGSGGEGLCRELVGLAVVTCGCECVLQGHGCAVSLVG